MPKISLIETADYNENTVRDAVARHFSALTFDRPRPGMRVVIKPNLIMRCAPERAATTHPALVEAVVRQLQELGVTDITIADSPGGLYTPQILAAAYDAAGYTDVAKRCGITCNLACGTREVPCPDGQLCRSFEVIDPVLDADYIVNLCKLKTHGMMTLSCGVKNLFGCVPGLKKPQLHYRFPEREPFAEMLLDLAGLVRPQLTIVDAVQAMEGDGPTGGTPRYMGFTAAAAGADVHSLDLVMAWMVGLSVREVPLLAAAVRRGLCPDTHEAVEILGEAGLCERLRTPDFQKPRSTTLDFAGNVPGFLRPVVKALRPVLVSRPVIRTKDCVGCGKCAESCPVHTIRLADGKAEILPAQCIRCYCCHEMCPVRAVDIKTPAVFRILSGTKMAKTMENSGEI